MMDLKPEDEFHDPPLKDAIRRCWVSECAPPELRERLSALLKEHTGNPRATQRPRRFSWVIWPVAAAAVLLLTFAVATRNRPRQPVETASILPLLLQDELILRHDRCSAHADHHHLKVPSDDDAAIAVAMRSQLNGPALVARPKEPGWTFTGAAICPVGTTPAGHLVFKNGQNALSVFSLPGSMLPGAVQGADYSAFRDDHAIVGFAKDGALFCLVESGPAGTVDVKNLERMRREMESSVALLPTRSETLAMAELLHPIPR